MLLYYVDMLLRYVDMLFYYVDIYFRDVKTSLCYVVTSFLYVMCKHHIIILNFSMTKITRVAFDAERTRRKRQIFILLCIERFGISDFYIRYLYNIKSIAWKLADLL